MFTCCLDSHHLSAAHTIRASFHRGVGVGGEGGGEGKGPSLALGGSREAGGEGQGGGGRVEAPGCCGVSDAVDALPAPPSAKSWAEMLGE